MINVPIKRTHNEFVRELNLTNPNIIPLETYVNNNTKIKCLCTIHDTSCYSTPKRLLQGRKCCPQCISEDKRNRLLLTHDIFMQRLQDKHIDVVPLEEYKGNTTKILFRCSCGDEWYTTPERVLLGNHCKKCGYKHMLGENNYFYNPNLSDEDRMNTDRRFRNPLYKKFIKACFERDNYTCQITDKKSTGDIVVHHINGYNWDVENRVNINNGITLNEDIHKEFHMLYGKGNNTKEQFVEFVNMLYQQDRISEEKYSSILERLIY